MNPVNTRGTCSDKTYQYNFWDIVQRGHITNVFTTPILTEILAEIVKLIHVLTLQTTGGHVEITPITTISEFRNPTYRVSMS